MAFLSHSDYFIFMMGRLIAPAHRNFEDERRRGVAFSRPYEVLNPNRGRSLVSPYLGFGFTTMAFFMIVVEGELFPSFLEKVDIGRCPRFDGTELKT